MPVTVLRTTDLADAGDLSEGDLVRWGPSNATRYGEIDSVHTSGRITSETEGEDETIMTASEDNPVFKIQHYDATDDGWEKTDTKTVHRADPLEKIDELPQDQSALGSDLFIVSSGPVTRKRWRPAGLASPPQDLDVYGVDTTPPQYMQDAASKGLEMVDDDKGGDGLQRQTVREARQIAEGEPLSREKIDKAAGFYSRNEGDYCPISDASDAQATSMYLWGGCDAGDWYRRKKDAIDEAEADEESDQSAARPARSGVTILRAQDDSRTGRGPSTSPSREPSRPSGGGRPLQANAEPAQDLRAAAESMRPADLVVERSRTEQLDATESDVEAINERHPGLALGADEIVMFRDYAVSTGPMRRRLRFTRDAIDRFQSLAEEGRPYCLHHDPERYVGSTLRASVQTEDVRGVEADWLVVDWYAILRDASEQRRQDLMDCQTGLQYTSIRFTGGDWESQELETEDGSEVIMIVDDNPPDGGQTAIDRLDMMHISRVELGAVKGAGADAGT